jgi:hypothetical protein
MSKEDLEIEVTSQDGAKIETHEQLEDAVGGYFLGEARMEEHLHKAMFDRTLREILIAKRGSKKNLTGQDVDEVLELIAGALHKLKFNI